MNNILKIILTIALVFIIYFLANFLSAFLVGVLAQVGGNIKLIGLQLAFDPLITIAYLILFYFLMLFQQPSAETQYKLFILTLFISFTVSFIQGSIFLIIFFWLLKRMRII